MVVDDFMVYSNFKLYIFIYHYVKLLLLQT